MLGVIGGSGLYQIDGLSDERWQRVESPWGAPSDDILTGTLNNAPIAFLPRHGRGHRIPPSEIPYRANIDALKRLGVTKIVSVSACGSFHEEMAPGHFVIVDQFIDRTRHRASSFFGTGCVAHVPFGHPTCGPLSARVAEAARASGITVHEGGTYLAMEGPQFSTLAESNLYRDVWGCHVIGMTNMPEAKLAREAEMCYAPIAMVTDYDCWHPDHDNVDVAQVISVMQSNSAKARDMLRALEVDMSTPCPDGCDRALEFALVTDPSVRDPELLAKLDAVAGRVLKTAGTEGEHA